MTKWEIISRISAWKKHKFDKDHLAELMDINQANNLLDITLEQAQEYYDEHAKEAKDTDD